VTKDHCAMYPLVKVGYRLTVSYSHLDRAASLSLISVLTSGVSYSVLDLQMLRDLTSLLFQEFFFRF
jgi:hypothetical protein